MEVDAVGNLLHLAAMEGGVESHRLKMLDKAKLFRTSSYQAFIYRKAFSYIFTTVTFDEEDLKGDKRRCYVGFDVEGIEEGVGDGDNVKVEFHIRIFAKYFCVSIFDHLDELFLVDLIVFKLIYRMLKACVEALCQKYTVDERVECEVFKIFVIFCGDIVFEPCES